jgi:hypothetical protein
MGGVEAALTYGISGWPTWVRHEGREMHWHVLEIIESDTAAASPACTDAYVLLAHGPFAYVPGEGEQYISATRRHGRWWIAPDTTVHPRRGPRPATDAAAQSACRLANGGGFACVNDGPALASALARLTADSDRRVSGLPALDAVQGLADFIRQLPGEQQKHGLRVLGISSMIRSSMASVVMPHGMVRGRRPRRDRITNVEGVLGRIA